MGYDLHIGLYGKTTETIGELVEAVSDELRPEYDILQVKHNRERTGGEREYLEAEAVKDRLVLVLNEMACQDEEMMIDFGSVHSERRPFLISSMLRGNSGVYGMCQAICGALKFDVPFEQFRPSDVTMLADVEEPPKTWDELLVKDSGQYDYEAAYRTFGRLVGLHTDWFHPFGVEHALAFANFSDPHESHMVYHVNISGFARDFEVLRHRYWEGSNGPVLYSEDLEMPPEEEIETRGWIDFEPLTKRIDDFYLRHFPNHSIGELHGFFQRIDDDVIDYFQSLSSEELRFQVELAAEETGRQWRPAAAGDGGAVVGPLHHDDGMTLRVLIDFYEFLLDHYDRATGKL